MNRRSNKECPEHAHLDDCHDGSRRLVALAKLSWRRSHELFLMRGHGYWRGEESRMQ